MRVVGNRDLYSSRPWSPSSTSPLGHINIPSRSNSNSNSTPLWKRWTNVDASFCCGAKVGGERSDYQSLQRVSAIKLAKRESVE